jgi:hypothetical protein
MNRSSCLIVTLTSLAGALIAAPIPNPFRAPDTTSPVTVSTHESPSCISISLTIPEQALDLASGIAGEGMTGRLGYPQLPAIGRWVRIPDHGDIQVICRPFNVRHIPGDPPEICSEGEDGLIAEPAALSGIYPPEPYTVSRPMVMRGVRMVSIACYPVRWDADNNEYRTTNNFTIDIQTVPGSGENEVPLLNRFPSRGLDKTLDALLLNPPRRDQNETYYPGGYLVVADDPPPEGTEEFLTAKRRAGHPVELLTFDPDVTDKAELRALIRDRYDETSFEFLVLMGNEDADPQLKIPYDNEFYDVYYAQLEGEDLLPDVAVGTFNCLDEDNFTCAIRRSLSYQYDPYFDDTDWFTRAGVAAGACSVPNDLSPSYTCKWIAEVLERRGFADIQTSYYSDNQTNDPSPLVEDLYNAKTNFIFVRAHEWDLNVDNIEATGVYPFHFLVSSGTITPPDNGAFNWAFQLGTPDDMRGPSAGFGHYSSPRTNIANALAGGLIWGMFFQDLGSYGWARNYAVANLALAMPEDGVDLMPYYYSHWRYYGDPGQGVWVGAPGEIVMEHPDSIDTDATHLQVRVLSTADNEPVSGATVCFVQPEGIQLVTLTDEDGYAHFTWGNGDPSQNEVWITITGDNLRPVSSSIEVIDAELALTVSNFEFVEVEGDGDGILNPGEHFRLIAEVVNTGTEDINGGTVSFVSLSPWIEGSLDSMFWAGLNAGEQDEICLSENNHGETFILPGCPDGLSLESLILFQLEDTTLVGGLFFNVVAPAFASTDIQADLIGGEAVDLRLNLANSGHKDSPALNATLETVSPFVNILRGDAQFPDIAIGEEAEIEGDPFSVMVADSVVPGMEARFRLILSGDLGVQDTLYFSIPIGEAAEGDPLGPDSYGYIALDNEDEDTDWAEAPEYDWIEICPWRDDRDFDGESLPIQMGAEADSTVLIELPFTFRYYGQEFDTISVCSNGWIAVGDQTSLKNQQNWTMPWSNGAFGMLAVFWDRLHYESRSDGLIGYYDQDGGRYILEWLAEVWNEDAGRRSNNIFEAIIYDPEVNETTTGDSPILFQYQTVNNVQDEWEANASCTVGISSPDGMDGLTYTYWNDYHPAAEPLQDERAILWTTLSWDTTEYGLVTGQVMRFIDSAAVAGMEVRTNDGFVAVTNDTGYYQMRLPLGEYNLTTGGSGGYGEAGQDAVLDEANEETDVDFVLPHSWLVCERDTILLEPQRGGLPVTLAFPINNIGNEDGEIDSVYFQREQWNDGVAFWIPLNQHHVTIRPGEDGLIGFSYWIDYAAPDGVSSGKLYIRNNSPIDTLIVTVIIQVGLGVGERSEAIPSQNELDEPVPNPFNAEVRIRYGVPSAVMVDIAICDVFGRDVATLSRREECTGWHQLTFDASNLPAGLYFIRMEAGSFHAVRRAVLVK